MIRRTALLADAAADGTLDEVFRRDADVQHTREREAKVLEDPRQGICLLDRAREAIEDESLLAVVFGKTLAHDADRDGIRDELACVHARFGLLAELRSLFDRGAEHVARGDMRDVECFDELSRLRALTGTRGAH